MHTLDLDFLRTRPASPWLRWLLLAIALGFAADVGFSYYFVHVRTAQNEEALARTRRAVDGAAHAAATLRPPTADEIRIGRETMRSLTTPWDKLFRALESAANERVALLAIEPDARSGTVLISGEATNYEATLAYVSALAANATLKRPHLVRHEEVQNASLKAVRFAISAAWGTEP